MRRKRSSMFRGQLPAVFDGEAPSFDERAGIPTALQQTVAHAVLARAHLPAGTSVLELGAGTGQIGFDLSHAVSHYVALDASAEMLDVFRRRYAAGATTPDLRVWDARGSWPVPPGSVGLVFGSRSLHWMTPEHLVSETLRVASAAGCAILIGRVVRSPEDPRRALRRELQRRLAETGWAPRRAEAHATSVIDESVRRGAEAIEEDVVARFERAVTLRRVIEGWRGRAALAGVEGVSVEARAALLDDLEKWAFRNLGDLDTHYTATEAYAIAGARFRS